MGMYAAHNVYYNAEGSVVHHYSVKMMAEHTNCFGSYCDQTSAVGGDRWVTGIGHLLVSTHENTSGKLVEFLNSDLVNRITDGGILSASIDWPTRWWDYTGDLKNLSDPDHFSPPGRRQAVYVRVDLRKNASAIICALRMGDRLWAIGDALRRYTQENRDKVLGCNAEILTLAACAQVGSTAHCDSYPAMFPVTAGEYREGCESHGWEVDDSYISEVMDGIVGGYKEITYFDIKSIHGRTREEFKDKLKHHNAELWQGYTKDDCLIEYDGLEGVPNDRILSIMAPITIDVGDPGRERSEVVPTSQYSIPEILEKLENMQ
ncbi:hypothetical protein Epa2_gp15 [Pseudomonas phage Epa2]|uniref:Uncharacterized protein n=1 Tax=Pseudomonas phage Epa4 TaxID=2719197 RepID=A0A6G9LG70_9CAUD|nr:hypothetical protein Epa2_gp15 [Pseudomonas phage Epa2]QIQ64447.1 hypothetical protein Epa4_gp15 [Pseudomonas phage Epa4]